MRRLFTKWGRSHSRGRDVGGKRRVSHLETLESRQLLSVAPVEYDGILTAYPELDLPAMVADSIPPQQDLNIIEINSAELSYESIRNSVELAETTPQDDLIVLRVSENHSRIDLGDTTFVIDTDPTLSGSLTIVSLGLTMPEFVTSSPDGAIRVEGGDVQLGGVTLLGAEGENGQTPTGWQLLQSADDASLTTSRIVFLNRTGGESSGATFETTTTGRFDASILTSSTDDPFYTTGFVSADATADYSTDTSSTQAFPVATDNYAAEFQLEGTTWAYLTGLSAEEVAKIEAGTFDVNDIDPYDAEKDGVADTQLCWAATASNMLRYTQWGMVEEMETEDDLLDYFTDCFTDVGSRIEFGIEWFLTGEYDAVDWSGWAQIKDGKADEGALWPEVEENLDDYMECVAFDVDGLTKIDAQLRQNSAVGIALGWMDGEMVRWGGHAITMWGYVYDSSVAVTDTARYTGLFVTDSDSYEGGMGRDADNVLHQYGIVWDADNSQYYFEEYGKSETMAGYLEDLTWLTQLPEELYAAQQEVTTLDDVVAEDGLLSLREAIELAKSQEQDSVIRFASNLRGGTIELTGEPIVLSGNVTIDGSDLASSPAGTPGITIDANGLSRIFDVQAGAVISVMNVAMVGGRTAVGDGGAIQNHGTLSLINCMVGGNEAIYGGGIGSDGTLTLTNCTVSGNRATCGGGGLYSTGTTTVNNTIVALNTAVFGEDLLDAASATTQTNYSLIGIDPKFVKTPSVIDATTTGCHYNSEDWDLRPYGDSPVINAGSNELAVDSDGRPLQTDLAGRERILENTVEIGAYEGSFDLETTDGGALHESGTTFTIRTAAIQNISATDAQAYSIKFYASKDSTVTSADTLLYTRSMAGLNAGEITTLTQTLSTSKLAIGEWYVGWIVVADGEINTTNNTGACPDVLKIEATISTDMLANDGGLLSDSQIVEGDKVTVTTAPIQNLGNVESGAWSVDFYALTESDLEDGGIENGLGTLLWTVDGIESLASEARTIVTATVDTSKLTPGTYTIAWNVPGLRGEWRTDNNVGYCSTQLVVVSRAEVPSTVVTTSEDVVDNMDGWISLREAIQYAGNSELGTEITFDSNLAGKTIRLSTEEGFGQLVIDRSLTINAMSLWNANAGTPGLTLDAGRKLSDADGRVLSIFNADETLDVTLKGLAITGGMVTPSDANRLEGNGGGIYINGENVTLQNVVVTGNRAGNGGGVFSQSGILSVEDSVIDGNVATVHGGGVYHDSGELTITDSTLSHNQAAASGGAIYSGNELLQVTGAMIFGNEAGRGGGVYSAGMGEDASGIANSLISGNVSTNVGAGIFASEDRLTITNCTVAGNVSSRDGSGLYSDGSTLVINNTIVANNPAGENGLDIYCDSQSEIGGDYNLLGTAFTFENGGEHNQVGDPAFVKIPWTIDETTAGLRYETMEWNLSLQSSSSAVNSGSNVRAIDANKHPLTVDLVGNARYYGYDGVVDVGAYEYQGAKTRFPTTPVNVEARATGISMVLLSWRESPEAVSYIVQRSTDGVSGWETIGSVYTERYVDSGLAANTPYFYRVVAENSFGISEPSSVIAVRTPIMDLDTVSGGSLTSSSVLSEEDFVIPYGATFTITTGWIRNLGNVASGKFSVDFYASLDGTLTSSDIRLGSVAMESLAAGASTKASIQVDTEWLAENAVYTVGWIVSGTSPDARTDNNVATVPQSLTVVSKIPSEPQGLVASVGTKSEISLRWNRVLGAVDYIVERSSDGMSQWKQVASTAQTYYTDGDLPLDTTFYYRVRARNAEGTSYASAVVSETTPESVFVAIPETPTNVVAVALTDTEIQVRWDEVADVTGYQILRSLDGGTSWMVLGAASENRFVDVGLTPDVTYYYRVKAVNTSGSSAASKIVHAKTLEKVEPE